MGHNSPCCLSWSDKSKVRNYMGHNHNDIGHNSIGHNRLCCLSSSDRSKAITI